MLVQNIIKWIGHDVFQDEVIPFGRVLLGLDSFGFPPLIFCLFLSFSFALRSDVVPQKEK